MAMEKRKIVPIVIVAAVVLVFVSVPAVLVFTGYGLPRWSECYIYEAIDECGAIAAQAGEGVTVEPIDSSDVDAHAQGLRIAHFYGARYTSADMTFTLYAYVFADTAEAAAYYNNTSGEHHSVGGEGYFGHNGSPTSYFVVLDDERAYCVETPDDCTDVQKFLGNFFSKRLFQPKMSIRIGNKTIVG